MMHLIGLTVKQGCGGKFTGSAESHGLATI
jgi:hypothetical protein